MKIILFVVVGFVFLYSNDFNTNNKIKVEYNYFNNNNDYKINYAKTLSFTNKIKYKTDNILFITNLYLQKDFKDSKRTFISLNEAYLKYKFNNSFIILGKEVKHWGILEEYNIVNIFNINSNLIDPFETNKIGNINLTYKYFFENDDSVEFITKIDEVKDKYPSKNNPYYPFVNFNYNNNFDTQKNKNRPTIFIKYNGYLENIDYSLVYMNGYDNQRDLKFISVDIINQYLYLVNKYMGYATYQNNNILYKIETSYTEVKDYNSISDYLQFGIGTEYTKKINDFNLVYIAEYYKYKQLNDNKKSINDLNIVFQNDLLLALKLEFNNQNSSSLTLSLLNDLDDKKEKVIKTTFKQRLFSDYKIEFSYLKITPSNKNNTYFKNIGKQDNIQFKIEYNF